MYRNYTERSSLISPPVFSLHSRYARYKTSAVALLVVVFASGCAVGPDFKRPAPPVGASYQHGGVSAHTASAPGEDGFAQVFARAATVRGDWYALFGSEKLDQLIAQALKNSPTVAAGQARLAAAREVVKAANGGRWPHLDAGFGVTHKQASGIEFGIQNPDFANEFTLYKGQLTLGYDVDIFGEQRRIIESKKARYAQHRYQLLATALTLVDNVVATVLTQVELRAESHAIRQIVQTQSRAVEIVSQQVRYGTATLADKARLRAQLAATRAHLPVLRKRLRLAHNRLAVLTGHAPGEFADPHITLANLQLPKRVPVAMPAQLIARRPDILAAVSRMRWANARIGVAQARLLPDFQLSASYSRAALAIEGLTDPVSLLYQVGGALTLPLFHGGTLRAQKRAAQDRYRAIAADYRHTVLSAFQQVADNLSALQLDVKILAARREALAAARNSRDIVELQVHAGAAGYLSLFQARAQYQEALIAAVDARLQRYRDTAALLRALGGGWWHESQSPLAQVTSLMPNHQYPKP